MRLRVIHPEERGLEAELDRLYALDQSCFHPGIAYTRAELRTFLTHPSAFSVLLESAQDGGELLGFSIARTMRTRGRAALHIITIDVAERARRHGVGTELMRWMAAKALEVRADLLRLEVAVDNEAALSFYRSLGFRPVERIPGYYLGSIDALVLEWTLTSRA
ncbi:MAG TPA: N-acetyltransferase [Acidobacteriaceae bacterium]